MMQSICFGAVIETGHGHLTQNRRARRGVEAVFVPVRVLGNPLDPQAYETRFPGVGFVFTGKDARRVRPLYERMLELVYWHSAKMPTGNVAGMVDNPGVIPALKDKLTGGRDREIREFVADKLGEQINDDADGIREVITAAKQRRAFSTEA